MEYGRGGYDHVERAAIADYLKKLDRKATIEAVSRGLIGIQNFFGKLDLQDIESMFRDGGCRTHLAAFPVDEKSDYEAHSLDNPRQKMPYYLMIIIDEQEAVEAKLSEIGSSPEENFKRLKETGFRVLKPGPMTSMMQKSRWN